MNTGALSKSDRTKDLVLRDELTAPDVEHVRSIATATDFFSPEEVMIAVELAEERLKRGDASGYFFLTACAGSRCVAFACYGPIACTRHSFDLYWVAVHPDLQGQGLGAKLVADVEDRVARAGGRRLYVETSGRAQYAPTRAFYERIGYLRETVLTDFYAPGDDKVIYLKILTA